MATQTSKRNKYYKCVIDDPADDTIDESKQVDKKMDELTEESTDHVHHLDDFLDDLGFGNELHDPAAKGNKCALIDEATDEDLDKKDSTSEDGLSFNNNDVNEDSHEVYNSNRYVDDEAKEDLQDSDGSDLDSFIDDEEQDCSSTGDDNTDDDI